MNEVSPSFVRNLITLRWFAVIGQTSAVLLAVSVLGVALDSRMLWLAIWLLGVFNLWCMWYASAARSLGARHVFIQIVVDSAVLAWLIAWSGGAMNPFTSLFLLPIPLVATALPTRWVLATAILCGIGYASAAAFGMPLAHIHGAFSNVFDAHLWGMAVNFVISACLLTWFLTRLARALRERDAQLARMREQFARNEGIIALATHAASVAHELNTPLGALTLLVEDQLDQENVSDRSRRDDLQTMAALIDACRDRVRELAAPARAASERMTLRESFERIVSAWQLLRPTIELTRLGVIADRAAVELDPAIGHLLQTLLNNAADASESAGRTRVDLKLDADDDMLVGVVRDYGRGFDSNNAFLPGALFQSTKQNGLGVGLALSHATVERLHGELSMCEAIGGGVSVQFRLPLHAQQEPIA